MTDISIVSTNNSELQSELLSTIPSYKESFIYNENRLYPTLFKKVVKQSPNTTVSGKQYGEQIVFDLPI